MSPRPYRKTASLMNVRGESGRQAMRPRPQPAPQWLFSACSAPRGVIGISRRSTYPAASSMSTTACSSRWRSNRLERLAAPARGDRAQRPPYRRAPPTSTDHLIPSENAPTARPRRAAPPALLPSSCRVGSLPQCVVSLLGSCRPVPLGRMGGTT